LERLPGPADVVDLNVALFLADDGHLLLKWPDANGESVALDIARATRMCFMASNGDELETPIAPRAVIRPHGEGVEQAPGSLG
jgi:hypothetical protein